MSATSLTFLFYFLVPISILKVLFQFPISGVGMIFVPILEGSTGAGNVYPRLVAVCYCGLVYYY